MKRKIIFNTILLLFFFFFVEEALTQERIIKSNDEWYYYDHGSLDNNWYKNLEIYKTWKKGKTPIGYGDRKIITEISYGTSKNKKDIVKYFINEINITNLKKYYGFELDIKRDDGIIIYLNGKEIYKNNLPIGPIFYNTRAVKLVDSDNEEIIFKKIINTQEFKEGKNIISVSVHQYSSRSSDCIFDLELLGHTNSNTLSNAMVSKKTTESNLDYKINDLNNKFQIERVSLQLDLLKSSNENFKYTLLILSFLLVFVLVATYILYQNFKNKNTTSENKILQLKSINIKKEQEMISLSTQLLHNKQYFKEIKADIRGIKTDDKILVKNIINQINFVLENDDDWKNLQEHFNMVYSGFYDAIYKLHPSLSETELRHCMFIKLQLQTKEIAKILLIDPRSVQTSRYRIKKKMNLNEDSDLRNYLLHLKC